MSSPLWEGWNRQQDEWGSLGVSGGLEVAILVAREADAEQAANLKHVDARPEEVESPALVSAE